MNGASLPVNYEPMVVENSPVEFFVIGSIGGRDRVVASSENAKLDLLGLAVRDTTPLLGVLNAVRSSVSPGGVSSMISGAIFGSTRKLNVVHSKPVSDLDVNLDPRLSSMRFAWVGDCSMELKGRIEDSFSSLVVDIRNAVIERDRSKLEWSVAPLVLDCDEYRIRVVRLRRIFLFTAIVYCLGLLGITVRVFLKSYF